MSMSALSTVLATVIDGAAADREADRVRQQVGQRGAELDRIDHHRDRLALDAHRQPVRLPLQPLGLDLLLDERQQRRAFAAQLARLEGGRVEAQQRLDLPLQRHGVLLQDLRHLALGRVERAGHAIFQQRHTFAQRGQRGLEFVRDVTQEACLVGVELDQPKPQPFELLRHPAHVGRAADIDRLVEPVLAQADDRAFEPLEGPRQPHAERQRQRRGQGAGRDHQPHEPLARGLDALGEFVVLGLDQELRLLRDLRVQRVELAELHRHGAFARQRSLGRAAHQALDHVELLAPAVGAVGGQAVGGEPAQHLTGVAGGVLEAAPQHGVVEHQRLAAGALHGRAALGQRLRGARERERAPRRIAALGHQDVVLEHRAQGHAHQQRGDQQEREQQQLLEGAAGRGQLRHQATGTGSAAAWPARVVSAVRISPRSV